MCVCVCVCVCAHELLAPSCSDMCSGNVWFDIIPRHKRCCHILSASECKFSNSKYYSRLELLIIWCNQIDQKYLELTRAMILAWVIWQKIIGYIYIYIPITTDTSIPITETFWASGHVRHVQGSASSCTSWKCIKESLEGWASMFGIQTCPNTLTYSRGVWKTRDMNTKELF